MQWLLRQQESALTPDERRELAEWLLQSPLHIDEYLAASTTWVVLSATDARAGLSQQALVAAAKAELENDNVVQLPWRSENAESPPSVTKTTTMAKRGNWARVAGVIGVVSVGILAVVALLQPPEYATVHGEQRRVPLADGSVITLNTNSRVRVRSSAKERAIELLKGEVRFQVAKDPNRPFVVMVDGTEVRALGTVFNVRLDSQRTQVAVVEGHVAVTVLQSMTDEVAASRIPPGKSAGAAELHAGERATIDGGAVEVGTGQPVEVANAWTERKLIFRDEALSSVISEFNRYRLHPLKLDDAELGSLKISGVFDIEDPDSLLSYLKNFETVSVRRSPDGTDHLVKSETS